MAKTFDPSFNVNNYVRVRLTGFGRRSHRNSHFALYHNWTEPPEYRPPVEDADGWSRWQLWDLMNQFGKYCFNGAQVPFETEIIIEGVTLPTRQRQSEEQ